jgi:hypothetical protein
LDSDRATGLREAEDIHGGPVMRGMIDAFAEDLLRQGDIFCAYVVPIPAYGRVN